MENVVAALARGIVRNSVVMMLAAGMALAQASGGTTDGPPAAGTERVLIVVAHPDDEACFAATVYEITHNLGGVVDQMVITNGEGGYRYSLLAEPVYGVALTDEAVGRAALPEIRKRELLEAGKILGVANHFFLDQRDVRYTQDIDEVLNEHWQPGVVLPEVERRVAEGHYDFVFTLFPSPETHGGHKASTITALKAVEQTAGRGPKPVVLGCQDAQSGAPEPVVAGVCERAASVPRGAGGVCDGPGGEVWIQGRARLSDHRQLGDRRAQIAGGVPDGYEPRRPRGICGAGECGDKRGCG